jgi:DNA-directed RNA polymerase specialized sigma24 family protein
MPDATPPRLAQERLDEAARFLGQMSEAESVERLIQNRELQDWVWTALQDLPEPQRVTVILRYFSCCKAGGSDQEIKEAVAVSALERHWSTVLNGMQVHLARFKKDLGGDTAAKP